MRELLEFKRDLFELVMVIVSGEKVFKKMIEYFYTKDREL
jgi:hypothetical protein